MFIIGYLVVFISLLKLTVKGDLIDSGCDGNCLECFKNYTCVQCIPKMFLNLGLNQCLSCPENCADCESSDTCLTCEPDFELETDQNNRTFCSKQNTKFKFSKAIKSILLLIVIVVFICLPIGLFFYKNFKKSSQYVQTLKEKQTPDEENPIQGVLLYLKQEEKMIQLNKGQKLPINVINQLEKLDTCHSIQKIEIN